MQKKKVGVTLPPALHDQIKMLSVRLGLNTEQAYQEALEHYLAEKEGVSASSESPDALRLARAYDTAIQSGGPVIRRIAEMLAGAILELPSDVGLPTKVATKRGRR